MYQKLITIFNISFQQGKFTSLVKIAKVVTIFKAGFKMKVGNYRPISFLKNLCTTDYTVTPSLRSIIFF